jgi:hypothetical protein
MSRHVIRAWPLLGWVLLQAGPNGDWGAVDRLSSQVRCTQLLEARVATDVLREIGSALADLPADNPIRQQAYARAERRVSARYRCQET